MRVWKTKGERNVDVIEETMDDLKQVGNCNVWSDFSPIGAAPSLGSAIREAWTMLFMRFTEHHLMML